MLAPLSEVFGNLKAEYDDDAVDRLNYMYTVFIIATFAMFVGVNQYVGTPIQCWVPAEFSSAKGWEKYAENYCLVENTYFLQPKEHVPDDPGVRVEKEINYYQWIPIILALQALMFYIPRLIWNMLNFSAGIHVPGLIEKVKVEKKTGTRWELVKGADIADCATVAAEHMVPLQINMPGDDNPPAGSLDEPDESTALCIPDGEQIGTTPTAKLLKSGKWRTTTLYITVKFLYMLNVISQFLIMNTFFSTNYTFWGVEILRDLLNNREWDNSGHFPRVTFCDFDINDIKEPRRYTVQCVLVINMFSEKIFLFLWWWFLLVSIVNILNFLYWAAISFSRRNSYEFVANYLRAKNVHMTFFSKEEQKVVDEKTNMDHFITFLHPDRILVLRLISDNVGDIVCSDVVAAMWNAFFRIRPSATAADGHKESLVEDKKEK